MPERQGLCAPHKDIPQLRNSHLWLQLLQSAAPLVRSTAWQHSAACPYSCLLSVGSSAKLMILWRIFQACRFVRSCASRLRSEENTSELQSLMRLSYALFCLNKK